MYLSYEKIDKIAETIMSDFNVAFFRDAREAKQPHATPIDQFASEYLNLDVKIERLCSDESICGITSYMDTELETSINGYKVCLPIKQNEVLLDIHFLQPGNIQKLCGKRRFTLAHECAHQLLFQMESMEAKAAYRKRYTGKKSHTAKELKTYEDWNEWQANVLGAGILLPQRDVSIIAKELLGDRKIISAYGYYSDKDSSVIYEIAGFFHASPPAVEIRLKRLGFIHDRTFEQTKDQRLEVCV